MSYIVLNFATILCNSSFPGAAEPGDWNSPIIQISRLFRVHCETGGLYAVLLFAQLVFTTNPIVTYHFVHI